MNTEIEKIQTTTEGAMDRVSRMLRGSYLVGLGAIALTGDSVRSLWTNSDDYARKLVERGSAIEDSGRERLSTWTERGRREARERAADVESTWVATSEKMLAAVRMPTSSDIEALTKKVNLINRKVNEVRRGQTNGVAAD